MGHGTAFARKDFALRAGRDNREIIESLSLETIKVIGGVVDSDSHGVASTSAIGPVGKGIGLSVERSVNPADGHTLGSDAMSSNALHTEAGRSGTDADVIDVEMIFIIGKVLNGHILCTRRHHSHILGPRRATFHLNCSAEGERGDLIGGTGETHGELLVIGSAGLVPEREYLGTSSHLELGRDKVLRRGRCVVKVETLGSRMGVRRRDSC